MADQGMVGNAKGGNVRRYPAAEKTLSHLVEDKAERLGSKVFLRFRDETVTYAQMDERANRVGNSLRQLGLEKGDKAALMMFNAPAFIYAWFGLSKIGAVETPINTAFRGDLLQYILNQSDSRVLLVDERLLDRIAFVEDQLPALERIIVYRDPQAPPVAPPKLKIPVMPFEELLEAKAERPRVEVQYSDPMALLYTSGTTGPSKGAVLSHHFLMLCAEENAELRDARSDDVIYTFLPLGHANAQTLTVMTGYVAEATVVIGGHFSASGFWHEIHHYGATQFNYLGAVLPILFKQPPRPDDADNPVRIAFGAAAPASIWREFEQRFNLKIVEAYGLTEGGMMAYNPLDKPKVGSFGKPTASYDVRVFDDEDNEVEPGTVGEMVMRPRVPYAMMSGYYRMPEKTLEVYRNLWFHTGDSCYMDEEGYLYFVDRKKDAMRRRGENISSFEVEKVVNQHPAVLESAAVAVKSDLGEDEVKIVVVLRDGHVLAPADLVEFCAERMAYFMVPRYVEFKAALPKTSTERVEKYKLRDEGVGGITESTWDREKAGYTLKR